MQETVPMFDGENAIIFKARMEAKLRIKDVWGAIEDFEHKHSTDTELLKSWKKMEGKARAYIILNVEEQYLITFEGLDSKQIWDKIDELWLSKSIGNLAAIKGKVENFKMDKKCGVVEELNRLESFRSQLKGTELEIKDAEMVIRVMNALPDSWSSFVQSLRANFKVDDLKNYSMFKAKIIAEEQIRNMLNDNENAKAFITKKFKKEYKKESIECYNCGKVGHYKKDCWAKGGGAERKGSKEYGGKAAKMEKSFAFMARKGKCQSSTPVEEWIFDSGASDHMCNNLRLMTNIQDVDISVSTADANSQIKVSKSGTVALTGHNGSKILLKNVFYVPDLEQNLLSASKFDSGNVIVKMEKGKINVSCDSQCIMTGSRTGNNMWLMNVKTVENGCKVNQANANGKISLMLLHERLGHLNFRDLKKLNIPYIDDQQLCRVCQLGKSKVKPFLKDGEKRISDPGSFIHSDYCGPMHIKGLNGEIGFWTYIDDCTGYVEIFLKTNNVKQVDCLIQLVNRWETKTGNKFKVLRCDNGYEYQSNKLVRYLSEKGAEIDSTNPYTPQQNGKAERMNRTLVEMARCLLNSAKLGKKYWPYAIMTAAYIRNRLPTSSNDTRTSPSELFTGKAPDYDYFKKMFYACTC